MRPTDDGTRPDESGELGTGHRRRPYRRPQLRPLGRVADVTLKTGMQIDLNQVRKPGMGGG